jgi:hypothetical protein
MSTESVRKPLPSLPQVSDKPPSIPPDSPEGKKTFEEFQASLAKLSQSSGQLDAIRAQARDLLTEAELEAYFDADAGSTQKIILSGGK